jgi:hypothetical protein
VAVIFNRNEAPAHLLAIHELDFSDDLFAERVEGIWFRLGAYTLEEIRDQNRVEEAIFRQTVLLAPEGFAAVFDKLESVGNVFSHLGNPGGVVRGAVGAKDYDYAPFHKFEFPFTSAVAEPLVFRHSDTSHVDLFVNPDLWIYLGLEEKSRGSGVWWDPRRGVDALVRRVLDDGRLITVEIRTDYLFKYLRARQLSLLVGHYRHLHFFDPPVASIAAFVSDEVVLGSPERGAKAILQNWGLRKDVFADAQFLQRRLHLWFEIKPPQIDVDDPWDERPSFDAYSFTLPTPSGPVAPARWRHLRDRETSKFEGVTCDFMDRVYFRQEVLTKYEGAAGFEVKDDGSVSCHSYWGLVRSTSRLGNELIATAIGDFAEGVPFEEWPHWKQYAVDPPSIETARSLAQEPQIPEAVNTVVAALNRLSAAFGDFADCIGVHLAEPLWRGSLGGLAGRQLKWVYPAAADDDEFLKRSTLASTLFLDGLLPSPMRTLSRSLGRNLHRTFDREPRTLGSRNLLQRVTLISLIIERLQPELGELPVLVQQAEGKATNASAELQAELESLSNCVREDFAPLAFLYDLRTSGGLAHPPSKDTAEAAAANLGLPKEKWHRKDYLSLLSRIVESLSRISERLEAAADQLARVRAMP